MPPFQLANQGVVTDPVTRQAKSASSWLDQFFAPVGQPLGQFAGGAARRIVAPFSSSGSDFPERVSTGVQHAAEGLPRTFAEALPFLVKSHPAFKAAGLADVALRSFAGQPESAPLESRLGATALETGGFLAAPKIGGGVGTAVAERLAPGSLLARRAGSALGNIGAFEGVNKLVANELGQPYGLEQMTTPEHIAGSIASVLPWEAGLGWHEYQSAKRAREQTEQRDLSPTVARPMTTSEDLRTASRTDLRPAIQTDQGLLYGEVGDSHADVLTRHGVRPESIPHIDPRRGFVHVDRPDQFLNRAQAEDLSGVEGTAKAGGLDSMDLPGSQLPPAAPARMEVPPEELHQTLARRAAQGSTIAMPRESKKATGEPAATEGESTIKLDVNIAQLMNLVGPQMYSKPIVEVATKELLQNAFDASRAAGATDKSPKSIHVVQDNTKRQLSVTDAGTGMTPDIIQKAFFTIGGTHKTGRPEETSGGLGLAKMAFILGSKHIRLETIKDGIKSVVDASSDQIRTSSFKVVSEKTDQPNGTMVRVTIPENFVDSRGEPQDIYMPSRPGFLSMPLLGPVNVFHNGTKLPIGVANTQYQHDNTFKFHWGKVEVYVDPKKTTYPEIHVLSSGLHQFKMGTYDIYGWDDDAKFPYNLVLDVRPSVRTDNPAYPFNNQREGFRSTIDEDLKAMKGFLAAMGTEQQILQAKETFASFKALSKVDPSKELTDEELEELSKRYKSGEGTKQGDVEAIGHKSVGVDFSNKGKVIVTYDDGATEEHETKRYVEKSFKAEREIDLGKAILDLSGHDPSIPTFHNNTSVEYDDIHGFDGMVTSLGNALLDFMRVWGEQNPSYDDLKARGGWFGGISLDKNYRGLNMVKPMKAIWFNPGTLSEAALTNPAAAASEALHIFIHEITHVNAREEGAGFTSELANNYARIRANQVPVEKYEKILEKQFAKYWETLRSFHERFNDYNTKNRAASFKSAAAVSAERRAAQGAGPSASPIDVQGDESIQESRLRRTGGVTEATPGAERIGDVLQSLARPMQQEGVKGAGTKIPVHVQRDLNRLDALDHNVVTIKNRATGEPLDKSPNESMVDYYARTRLGEGYEKINKPNDPTTLLSHVKGYFDWVFKDVLQLPKEEADRLSYFGLRIASVAGRGLGETRLLPAMSYKDNLGLRASSFYAPSRGQVANSFIGLLPPWWASPEGTARTVLNKDMFLTFHALAHELFHAKVLQAQGKTFTTEPATPREVKAVSALLDQVKDMSRDEMGQTMTQVLKTMATSAHGKMLDYRHKFYDESDIGRTEFLADLFGLYAMGAATPERTRPWTHVNDILLYSNEDFRDFTRGMIREFGTALSYLGDAARKLMGWKPSSVAQVEKMYSNMTRLMRSAQDADDHIKAFSQIMEIRDARPWKPTQAIDYGRIERFYRSLGAKYDDSLRQIVDEVSPMVVAQADKSPTIEGRQLKFHEYFIAISQMAQQIPKLADMGWLGRQVGTKSKEMVDVIGSMFTNPTAERKDMFGKLQEFAGYSEGLNDVLLLAKENTPLNKAWSKVMLMQNALSDQRQGQRLRQDEIKSIKEYRDLSPADRERFDRLNDQRAAAMQYLAKKHYDSFRNKIGSNFIAQGLMSHDRTLKWQDAQKVGEAMAGLNLDSDVYALDPQTAHELFGDRAKMRQIVNEYVMKGPAQINAVTQMNKAFTHDAQGNELPVKDNKTLQSLLAHRGQLLGPFDQDPATGRWNFRGNPGYSPEVRSGRWTLAWKPVGGESQLVGFKDKQAFDAKLASLNKEKAAGKIQYLKYTDKTDNQDAYGGMSPERFRLYNDAVEKFTNSVLARLGNEHPELSNEIRQELMDDLKPARALSAMLESPYMKERRLVGGRETLNMGEGMVNYISNSAYTIAKRYESAQQSLFLKDPVMRENPQLRSVAGRYFKEIMDPTDRGYSWLKKLIAFNYIFFSPSLAFVEGTQQITNHIPALATRGMGIGEALSALKTGNFDVANAYLAGTQKGLPYDVYKSEEETRIMKDAANKGIVGGGVGWLQEAWDLQRDVDFINRRNFFGGSGELVDRTSLLGRPLYYLYKVGTNLHGIAIALNTKVAFLTAYRHFRSQGLSEESAFRQADELTVESMHGGGRASRPLWFLGIGPGNPGSSVGSLMYSLQMYVYNTIAQMGRYLKQSIDSNVKDVSQRANARRAAASMIAAQVVLAGVGGIPISNQILALIEQMFPNTEPRRRMREMFFGVGKWLNSKAHLVGQDDDMGQFVATAASDGLMNAVAPWNIGNRFELSALMGVDPYKGFQWSSVVGPAGPLIEHMFTKVGPAMARGDWEEGLTQAIPNSNIRRLADTALHGWDLRNQDSRLNLKLDQSERWLLASGFTPKRVAEFRELDNMHRRAEKAASFDQKAFHEHLAEQVTSGDYNSVSQALLQRAATQPNYDPRIGARRVAELALQRTEPYDPLRQGSRTSRSYTIGRLFDRQGLDAAPPSTETSRLLAKIGITQQLGLPTPPSPREFQIAQLVDQLMAANPRMSRQEALTMLARVLNPRLGAYLGASSTEEGVQAQP